MSDNGRRVHSRPFAGVPLAAGATTLEAAGWGAAGGSLRRVSGYTNCARAELFLKKTNTTFSNYIDQKLFLEHMLGADRLPLTLLVDAQGKVLGKFTGAKEWDGPEAAAIISKAFGIKL